MQHSNSYVMSFGEIAGRLQQLMQQNCGVARPDKPPIAAIARYLDIHRDTLYSIARGEAVGRMLQLLLSRFLLQLEAGELEGKKQRTGEWEICVVKNPSPRHLLRINLNLGGQGPTLDRSRPQHVPKMPVFAALFSGR
jgi:hypothetical protein